jgi:hypothetical protein
VKSPFTRETDPDPRSSGDISVSRSILFEEVAAFSFAKLGPPRPVPVTPAAYRRSGPAKLHEKMRRKLFISQALSRATCF